MGFQSGSGELCKDRVGTAAGDITASVGAIVLSPKGRGTGSALNPLTPITARNSDSHTIQIVQVEGLRTYLLLCFGSLTSLPSLT